MWISKEYIKALQTRTDLVPIDDRQVRWLHFNNSEIALKQYSDCFGKFSHFVEPRATHLVYKNTANGAKYAISKEDYLSLPREFHRLQTQITLP